MTAKSEWKIGDGTRVNDGGNAATQREERGILSRSHEQASVDKMEQVEPDR